MLRIFAGQQADINVGGGHAGDNVGLLRALEHGERNRVAQQVIRCRIALQRGGELRVFQARFQVAKIARPLGRLVGGHDFEEFIHYGNDFQLGLPVDDLVQRPDQVIGSRVGDRPRAVPGISRGGDGQPEGRFFGHVHADEFRLAVFIHIFAALGD